MKTMQLGFQVGADFNFSTSVKSLVGDSACVSGVTDKLLFSVGYLSALALRAVPCKLSSSLLGWS